MRYLKSWLREQVRRRIRIQKLTPAMRVFRLSPNGKPRGRVLMSYSVHLYERLFCGEKIDFNGHHSAWMNFNISKIFLDIGFQVDVIAFDNSRVIIGSNYDVIFDVRSNLERLSGFVSSDCVKLMYPMFGHWAVHNTNQYVRHAALLHRKGRSLVPSRIIPSTRSIEVADHIIHRGGDFANAGFKHSNARIHRIPQVHPLAYNKFVDRDYEKCKRRFIWLGGFGAVHKGLDLILEGFSRLPDCELYVCGDIAAEKEFEDFYRHELYDLPNIHTIGWIDPMSKRWRDISSHCGAILLHSASEVRAVSIITGILSGLIPVANDACDHDLDHFGFEIKQNTVEAVIETVENVCNTSNAMLASMSHTAYEVAHSRFGQAKALNGFRLALGEVLGLKLSDSWKPANDKDRVPSVRDVTHKFGIAS